MKRIDDGVESDKRDREIITISICWFASGVIAILIDAYASRTGSALTRYFGILAICVGAAILVLRRRINAIMERYQHKGIHR